MITEEQLREGIVLALDKPRQWTSFQAVNKVKAGVRHALGLKKFKIGHAGTLDPLATGLLLICIGKATKSIAQLQEGDKVYSGEMVFGATTPCYDMEQPIDHLYAYSHIDKKGIEKAAEGFIGEVWQRPPIYSAVKIDGQRAYEYARAEGEENIVQPKKIKIYSIEITSFTPGDASKDAGEKILSSPSAEESTHLRSTHLYDHPAEEIPDYLPRMTFRIRCGKGTYIRSIARDLGTALGSGAFLSALRRESVGEYTVDKAIGIDEVEDWITK